LTKNYPKVLIIGENFHSTSGGGITISNLFKGWPKSKIAVADFPDGVMKISSNIDFQLYQLGNKEFKMSHPFNYLSSSYESKPVPTGNVSFVEERKSINNLSNKPRFKKIISKYFLYLTNLFGVYHFINKSTISDEFITWVKDFNPNFVYTQLSRRDLILFITQFNKEFNIPIVIHIMDDWPSTISPPGLLQNYWKKRIDKEFRNLLDNSYKLLSISDSMSEEYKRRYKKVFLPFHNPIDINLWKQNKNEKKKDSVFNILHAGRVGLGISSSLITLASVIQELDDDGYDIKLNIQSSKIDQNFLDKIIKYDCVKINPPVDYVEIPNIIMNSDLLVICNDFDSKGREFLKYSMPTKASEYMISKVPILLFSPASSGIVKHAKKNKWAYIVDEDNKRLLKEALIELRTNTLLKKKLINNAYIYARDNYDSVIVCRRFKEIFN